MHVGLQNLTLSSLIFPLNTRDNFLCFSFNWLTTADIEKCRYIKNVPHIRFFMDRISFIFKCPFRVYRTLFMRGD